MHETSIALAVVDQIAERARQEARTGVRAVGLRIGELAGVVPEALEFCFAQACEGTVAQGAALGIEAVEARARCGACSHEWSVGMPPDLCCPLCDAAAAHLISGRELEITAVEWGVGPRAVPAPGPEEPDPCAV
jgi:hydrogenase nickel incorporation protein HypA/HybF